MGWGSHQAMGFVDNILLHLSFLCYPWEEGGQAWTHAVIMKQMPDLGLWEHQPSPGNSLYTISVAAEVGGEIWTLRLGSTDGVSSGTWEL